MVSERYIKPTVSYHLFLYRTELARRNRREIRLLRTKIDIIDELSSIGVENLKKSSIYDLVAIIRQLIFKQKLRKQIVKLRRAAKNERKSVSDTDRTSAPQETLSLAPPQPADSSEIQESQKDGK